MRFADEHVQHGGDGARPGGRREPDAVRRERRPEVAGGAARSGRHLRAGEKVGAEPEMAQEAAAVGAGGRRVLRDPGFYVLCEVGVCRGAGDRGGGGVQAVFLMGVIPVGWVGSFRGGWLADKTGFCRNLIGRGKQAGAAVRPIKSRVVSNLSVEISKLVRRLTDKIGPCLGLIG